MKKLTTALIVAAMLATAPVVHARVFKKLAIVAAVVVGAQAMAKNKKETNEQAGHNGQPAKNDKNRREQ